MMLEQATRAADFAARKHVGQKRKGAAAEPYINHLAEVATLVASSVREPDWMLICAAWLHDTLEDTATTREELIEVFGERVTGIVAEVTDDKSLPKSERKRLQVENTPKKSNEAKQIKLADKTSNLRSLASSPPEWWDEARVLAYVDWAEQVVRTCLPLNEPLAREFHAAADAVRRKAAATPRPAGT
jgi:(p)ppGpp synthase/HD superfamily hydrolase